MSIVAAATLPVRQLVIGSTPVTTIQPVQGFRGPVNIELKIQVRFVRFDAALLLVLSSLCFSVVRLACFTHFVLVATTSQVSVSYSSSISVAAFCFICF